MSELKGISGVHHRPELGCRYRSGSRYGRPLMQCMMVNFVESSDGVAQYSVFTVRPAAAVRVIRFALFPCHAAQYLTWEVASVRDTSWETLVV